MKFFVTTIVLVLTLCSCSMLRDDNPVEELVEDVFQDYTGVKVDITGDSPEDG